MLSRLLVVDQSLKDYSGHHHDYSRVVIETARRAGIGVALACHRAFPGVELAGAPVVGRFSGDRNEAGRAGLHALARKAVVGMPEKARHLAMRGLHRLADQARPPVPAPRFARELFAIIVNANLGATDHVFVHTLGESELLGLAEALRHGTARLPHLHILLRYDGTEECRHAFAELGALPPRLSFWTDTEQLAAHYRDLGCQNIGVLPIPHGLDASIIRRRPEGAPLTLAYLGGARGDKGFHLLPDLIAALADDHLATHRARFLIQTSYSFSREEPLMARTKRSLARFPRSWVALIEAPLDTAAFAQALASTDLLLLPYDPETYRRRSSGLLVQAMVAGIPVIVPEGTWLATAAPEGAHAAFGKSIKLEDATRHAITHHGEYASVAQTSAIAARDRHNAKMLLERLVAS
jgi:hypothetical protein